MSLQQSTEHPIVLFQRLDDYDWDNDREFQGGLRAILNSAGTPDQIDHLTTRAKCYYFARKFKTPIDFEGYLAWNKMQKDMLNGVSTSDTAEPFTSQISAPSESTVPEATSTIGSAPPPASFAEICELIAAGKPIPGIKDIPDTVLEGQGTQSQASKRKKPWETNSDPAPTPSWAVKN